MEARYQILEKGVKNTNTYSIYFPTNCGKIISPWHDIPLHADAEGNTLNMIVEMPRWSNAKMEVNLATPLNPIKQLMRGTRLHYVPNCFPYKGYIWNYGILPQTWEDPNASDDVLMTKGNNGPINVLEIGERVAKCGEVLKVKALGIFAIIDNSGLNWRILAVDVNDPLACKLSCLPDINEHFPGLLEGTVDLMQICRIPEGKKELTIAFHQEPQCAKYAKKIITNSHKSWHKLLHDHDAEPADISCVNVSNKQSKFYIDNLKATKILDKVPCDAIVREWLIMGDCAVNDWSFIHRPLLPEMEPEDSDDE